MADIIVPTVVDTIKWDDLRKGLSECIKAVTTNARVYSSWPLKYDIGETVKLLLSPDDNEKVHAWIIGVNKADPTEPKIGGHNLSWELNIRVWGFFGYDSVYTADTQTKMEEEVRAVTQVIYANSRHFGMDNINALATSGIITWDDIDVHGFGDDNDVIVAQGNLTVTIREHYDGY